MRSPNIFSSKLALVFFVLGTSAFPQAASSPALQSYHNDTHKFTYSYPSDFTLMPKQEKDSAIQSEKDKAGGVAKSMFQCLSVPLTALRQSNDFAMTVLLDMDGDCVGSKFLSDGLGAMAKSTLSNSLARFGTPALGDPVNYKIGDLDAAVTFGTVQYAKVAGVTFHGAVSCWLESNHTFCVELLATQTDALNKLLADPLQYDGKDAHALIPENFSQKP